MGRAGGRCRRRRCQPLLPPALGAHHTRCLHVRPSLQVLSDPQKRDIYDVYGREGLAAGLEVRGSLGRAGSRSLDARQRAAAGAVSDRSLQLRPAVVIACAR